MLVTLLVGAKYGMSQVINHKLNVISTLVEFSSISRVELLTESDKVSLLRISLHDMKVRGALGGIYMFIELQGCIIRKHIDVAQMFIHHTIFMNMTLNIGQAFFLYYTCNI